ncbi:MAG: FMN-binding negative transcriptional regulator [Bacteriovoracaceae bacterium]|nr:FMN-binding negative transcriptional regulator [Bacteriovoracaceae bacterium]
MYIPKYASTNNEELIKSFILKHSFGTLISSKGKNANHYPFLLSEEDGKIILWTHLARNNPQWQELNSQQCLVIFTGPHRYISPTYYLNELNVPTWSYTAVHASCNSKIISDDNLERELMKKMVSFYENKNGTEWAYDLPEDFHQKLLKAIVWVRLEVFSLEGKFKLSQNREQADYENILQILSGKSGDNDKELLEYMQLTNPFK